MGSSNANNTTPRGNGSQVRRASPTITPSQPADRSLLRLKYRRAPVAAYPRPAIRGVGVADVIAGKKNDREQSGK